MGETNSPLAGIDLSNYQIGDGTVSVKIIDLERYANINTAAAPEIQQALTLMGVDAGYISVVSDSIQDWVQPGDAPRIAGAKDDYYLGLNPPYNCKEAPVDDLSELLLVKGIWDHPEIYWGGAATNHPGASFQHHLGFGNARRDAQLSLRAGGPVHALFLRENQHQHRRRERPAIASRHGQDDTAADSILKFRAGPDGVDRHGRRHAVSKPQPARRRRRQSRGGPRRWAAFATCAAPPSRSPSPRASAITSATSTPSSSATARNVQVVSFYWNY